MYVCIAHEIRKGDITRNEKTFRRGRKNKNGNIMKCIGRKKRMGVYGKRGPERQSIENVCKCITKPIILCDNF